MDRLQVPALLLGCAVLISLALLRLNNPPTSPREERALYTATEYFDTGLYYRSASRYRRVLSLNPDNIFARRQLDILGTHGLPAGFYETGKALVSALTLGESITDSGYLKMITGELLRRENQPDKAIEFHQQATELAPELPHNWFLLGTAFARAGRHEEAILALDNALELHPGNRYTYALAQQFLFLKRYPEALDTFRRSSEIASYRVDSRLGEARALIALGRLDEARASLNKLRSHLDTGSQAALKFSRTARILKAGQRFSTVKNISSVDLSRYVSVLIEWIDAMRLSPDAEPGTTGDERLDALLEFDRSLV